MPEEKVLEIEIKSLLGNRDRAEELLKKMKESDPNLELLGVNSQLNHYFVGGDLKALVESVGDKIDPASKNELTGLTDASDYSLRTRFTDGKILLVLKTSRDSASSANSTNRIEFEAAVNLPNLNDLDELVLASGFGYQAKWSRERREYRFLDVTVTLDKNAGYGYLAEFEVIERDPGKVELAKARLKNIMDNFGVEELDQARLERMFKFYNNNWQDYYGTEKVFVVE